MKKLENNLKWKLVWDIETKEVLLFKKINGEFETISALFESKNKNDIYDKINELGLNYNPTLLEQEEWV